MSKENIELVDARGGWTPGKLEYKPLFSLDPSVTYLNHGSFGACPKVIFDSLINFQKHFPI